MNSTAVYQNRKPPPLKFLELLYPIPQPLRTLEDHWRFCHADLPDLTDIELARELSRVWRRLTLEWPKADHWLWARRAAVFAERDRRRAGRARS